MGDRLRTGLRWREGVERGAYCAAVYESVRRVTSHNLAYGLLHHLIKPTVFTATAARASLHPHFSLYSHIHHSVSDTGACLAA